MVYSIEKARGKLQEFRDILSQSNKDLPDGNIAYLEAFRNEASVYVGGAYSNVSKLEPHLKERFAPSLSAQWFNKFGIAGACQQANHTEPKLVAQLIDYRRTNPFEVDTIILVSEMDCCKSCLGTSVAELGGLSGLVSLDTKTPLTIWVIQAGSGTWGNAAAM